MNKQNRESWLILTTIECPLPYDGFVSLCHFCKYAKWSGGCKFPDLDCLHGLVIIQDDCWEVWAGADCWGFRPKYYLYDAIDAIGILLQGKEVDWNSLPKIGFGSVAFRLITDNEVRNEA